MVAQPLLFLM